MEIIFVLWKNMFKHFYIYKASDNNSTTLNKGAATMQ